MEKGVIATLGDRSSGFIKTRTHTDTLFFHADAVVNTAFSTLKAGDHVLFTRTESKKGPYATRVERA